MNWKKVLRVVGGLLVVVLALSGSVGAYVYTQINPEMATFAHDGMTREYLLYLPEQLPENAPLVFVLHGYKMRARDLYFYSGMNGIADREGFAVVYPQGSLDDQSATHWNANLNVRPEGDEIDDVGFLTALAADLQKRHGLDPERTFSAGLSNGGFMGYHLALEVPEAFAAVASVVGTMSGDDWAQRDTATPKPVLQISGTVDETVPIDGSMGPDRGWGGAPHMDEVMAFWAEANGCTTEEAVRLEPDTAVVRHSGGKALVWDYRVEGFGHNWPGGRAAVLGYTVAEAPPTAIDASEVIWEFFSTVMENPGAAASQ